MTILNDVAMLHHH